MGTPHLKGGISEKAVRRAARRAARRAVVRHLLCLVGDHQPGLLRLHQPEHVFSLQLQ